MGIIDKIKKDAQRVGVSKENIFYVKSDSKARIRFLEELDDGIDLTFHRAFEEKIDALCGEEYGTDCPYCGDNSDIEELKTKKRYCWSIFNYESNKVEIMCYPMSDQFSPVSALLEMNEEYGTITDRDYVIKKRGSKLSTSYSVVPQDICKFRNAKAKPFPRKKVLELLCKAFPLDYNVDMDEDEDKPKKGKKPGKKGDKGSKKDSSKYASMDDLEEDDSATKNLSDEKVAKYVRKQLEKNDIDEDEFIEFAEVKNMKDLSKKSKAKIDKLIEQYIEDMEEEDEDDEEESIQGQVEGLDLNDKKELAKILGVDKKIIKSNDADEIEEAILEYDEDEIEEALEGFDLPF